MITILNDYETICNDSATVRIRLLQQFATINLAQSSWNTSFSIRNCFEIVLPDSWEEGRNWVFPKRDFESGKKAKKRISSQWTASLRTGVIWDFLETKNAWMWFSFLIILSMKINHSAASDDPEIAVGRCFWTTRFLSTNSKISKQSWFDLMNHNKEAVGEKRGGGGGGGGGGG